MRRLVLLLPLLLATPAFGDVGCRDDVTRSATFRKLLEGLPRLFAFRGAEWEVVGAEPDATVVLGGLTESDFRDAHDTAKELKDLIEQARQGKIRGFGVVPSESAATRVAAWGITFATAAAGLCFLPEDCHVIFATLAKGLTAYSALRTLRWMRTLDDNLSRETGQAESNLWSALGPVQSPLQYWLREYYKDGIVKVVLIFSRHSSRYIANLLRNSNGAEIPPDVAVRIPLGHW